MTDKKNNLREQAEGKATQLQENIESLSLEETRQMLHELRVHKIELEMQNEELRRTQAELAESRACYFDLYDLAPVGYCTISEKGLILEANLTAATMLGLTHRGALANIPFSQYIFKEDQDIYYRHRKQLFETDEPNPCELRMVKMDGTLFWACLETTAAKGTDGAPTYRMVISNITGRIETEKDLRKSQEQLRDAHRLAHIGIWNWNADTDTVIWTEELYRIAGLDPMTPAPTYAEHHHIYAPESWDRLKVAVEKALETGAPYQLELVLIRPDGATRMVNAFGGATHDKQGRTTGLYGTVQDITERKQREETLRLQAAIMETVAEGIFLIGFEDNIIKWTNRKFEKLFGYDPGEMVGMHVDKVNAPTEKNPKETRMSIVDVLRDTGEWHGEIQNIKKDGTYFWSYIHVSLFDHPIFGTVMVSAQTDITDRKLAEESLREQKERFRLITETIDEVFWMADVDIERMFYISPSYEQVWGRSRDGLYENPHSFLDAVHVEDRERVIVGLTIEKSGQPFEHEYRIVLPDGTIRHIWDRGFPVHDEKGQVYSYAGIAIDITERKRIEDELKSAHIKLESLWNVSSLSSANTKMVFDHILESIAQMTQSEYGFYGFINDDESVMIIYSWSGEAMKDCSMVDKPQHFPISEAGVWAEAIRRREPFILNDYAATNIAKKGLPEGHVELTNLIVVPHFTQDRITSVAAVANRHADYNINDVNQITAFLNSVQTIVDSKQAEEAVRESQQRLTDIIDFLPDATLVIDKNGKVIAWNRAIESMTGIKAEAMLGKDNYEYALPFYGERKPILIDIALHPDLTKEKLYTIIHRMGDVVFGEAYTPALAPGNVHLSGTASVLRNSTGEIVGAIECIRNNTDRKNMEERLQRAEKMEALGLLAGGVAHDLNNALGILVGYSEFLHDSLDETDPLREDAMNIMKGGEQAAAIVQDLLTLARRGVQTKTVININKTVNEYLKSPEYLKLTSFHPTVRIKTELEGEILKIVASPVHLSKTLNNLISNAAEAMPSGGDIVIHTENRYMDRPVSGYDTVQEGDYVVLSVTDEGEGITDDDMKRIFEPFYTKKVMGRSGTGLGLAVVWGTVKDHNGYIDVQSRRGEGTTFILYFPVTQEEIAEDKVTMPDEYMGRGEKILVVDDIKDQRDLATRILSKLNYQVEVVSSGEECVEYLKLKESDLIVLDMIMEPGIDGLETYRQISEIRPKQKAIIVSGFSETDRVNMAQSLGAGVFVKKPYIRERIGLAVRKELDRK